MAARRPTARAGRFRAARVLRARPMKHAGRATETQKGRRWAGARAALFQQVLLLRAQLLQLRHRSRPEVAVLPRQRLQRVEVLPDLRQLCVKHHPVAFQGGDDTCEVHVGVDAGRLLRAARGGGHAALCARDRALTRSPRPARLHTRGAVAAPTRSGTPSLKGASPQWLRSAEF